jgi:hypothetical protein
VTSSPTRVEWLELLAHRAERAGMTVEVTATRKELYRAMTSAGIDPLVGLRIRLQRRTDKDRPCCQSVGVLIQGCGQHAYGIVCEGCGSRRSWLSI